MNLDTIIRQIYIFSIFFLANKIYSYPVLYISDLQDPTMLYFGKWTVSDYEDLSHTFWFQVNSKQHRYENNTVTTISKVYKTGDPHYKITINFDIVIFSLNKSNTECSELYTGSHLDNPLCKISYDWEKGKDFIIVLIDGKPYKFDDFSNSQQLNGNTVLNFSITIPHVRQTLSFDFIPYNTKWNLFTTLENLNIYYEVCSDNCLCLSCSDEGKCLQCQYTYYYDSSSQKCKSCQLNCFYCSDSQTCLSCVEGYFLNTQNGQCEDQTLHPNSIGIEGKWVAQPDPNCEIWDNQLQPQCIVKKQTQVCLPGFFGDGCNQQCDSILNCQTCSQNLSCDTCNQLNQYYYNQICSAQCYQYGYYAKSKTECDNCHYTCYTCNGPLQTNCLSCRTENYYFMESTNECVVCQDTYFANDVDNRCDLCENVLSNCYKCKNVGNQPYCQQCKDGSFLYQGKCYPNCLNFQNTKQFGPPLNECIACYDGCLSCKEFIIDQECTVCAPNFFQYQNMCLPSCDNAIGTYPDTTQMRCLNCQDYNCLACQGAGYNQCTKCSSYTQLVSGTCKLCASNQFFNQFQSICQDCPLNCELCTEQNKCSLCKLGFFLDSQQPGSPCVSFCSGIQYGDITTRVCIKCPPGTVKNQNTGNCDKCEEGCQICQSNGKCTQCFPNYILNACNSGGKQCTQCPQPNQYSIGSNSQCFNCDSICKNCFGAGPLNCVQCADGYFKADNNLCLECDPSCQACKLGPKFCISCKPGYDYISYESSLPKSKYKTCYKTCPPNQNTDQQNKICYSCSYACKTCSGPGDNQCLTCIDNINGFPLYKTSDNKCLIQCPLNTYSDLATKSCLACDKSCSQCVGPAPTDCTVCSDGYIYRAASKMCLIECPTGEYNQRVSNTCEKCMSLCYTCVNANQCTSCPSPQYLSNDGTQCLAQCPQDQYQNEDNRKCIICPTNCLKCESIKQCTACKKGFLLQNGQCVNSCSDGFYLSNDSSQCLPCSSQCAQCNEQTCLKCEIKSYVILGKECLQQCPKGYVLRQGICITSEDDIKRYMDCYSNCDQEVKFAQDSDDAVKSIEITQSSMNGFAMFFGGLGNYFFYWLQMQQIMGNMMFLKNARALGIGNLHLKTLYMENLFNLIPIVAPEEDVIQNFSGRTDAIAQGLQPQNLYTYFVQNCQYSLSALAIGFLILPILYKIARDNEFLNLLYLYCKWNVLIRLIMISSNFLLLCTFFKFQQGSMTGSLNVADFFCIAIFLVIYIAIFSFLIYCNKKMELPYHTQRSINAFYYDIETSSFFQKSFWVFFEIRKLIVCLLIVVTEGSVAVPWIYLVLCIVFLTYHYKMNPFLNLLLQRYIFISEIINILCLLFLSLSVTFYQQTASVYFAYVFVIFLIIYQLWAFVTQLYQLAKLLITLFLKYKVPRSPNQRNRTVSKQPFLLKDSLGSNQKQEIIEQINQNINFTDISGKSPVQSPRKKRETQGLFQLQKN
ncbi:hypothetical protein ABPG74_014038 [Tetrahymena malaccensis]